MTNPIELGRRIEKAAEAVRRARALVDVTTRGRLGVVVRAAAFARDRYQTLVDEHEDHFGPYVGADYHFA